MQFVLFRAARARHPLLRIVFAVLGMLIFAGLLLFGLFAAIALVLIGGVVWLIRHFGQAQPRAVPETHQQAPRASVPDGVLEGEFVVVSHDNHRQAR